MWRVAARAAAAVTAGTLFGGERGIVQTDTTYTRAQVAEHTSVAKRVWVTHRDGVYDVTDFVALHPGGDKIMLAAGGSVDPFWAVYQQHRGEHVAELLGKFRIGTLDAADAAAAATAAAAVGDPFANDPPRSPLLVKRSQKPFNGEPPLSLLGDHFVTPTDVMFVRNHLPVPDVDEASYALDIEHSDGSVLRITYEDLKSRFPRHDVTSVLQCAGNRRADMGDRTARATRGLLWDAGAIANVTWTGARLRDVLLYAGLRDEDVGA